MCNVHANGQGQAYTDCTDGVGVPGNAATYNVTMADDAAKAYSATGTVSPKLCGTPSDSCVQIVTTGTGAACVVWCYTGALAGYQLKSGASACTCPTTSSTPTWH
jgi:hypothetical protein